MLEKIKKYRKLLIVSISILFVVVSALFLIFKPNDNTQINDATININKEENLVKRKLYLLTNDNFVVPVTISMSKKDSLADELYYVVSLLREDSKAIKGSFKGILNKDTSITELTIKDQILTLGFSKEFNDYEKENELRIVEALVWTMSQYEEINAINIKVEDELLTRMPLGKTPLPSTLTKDFGINNHIFPTMLNKERAVVYYSKVIDDQEFYVPVSNNIEIDSISVFFELSKKNVPLITGLNVIKELKDLEVVNITSSEEKVNFELTSSSLLEENLIDYELYSILQVALSSFVENVKISIQVEGEEVKVDGINDENEMLVSNLVYNEIFL